MTVDTTQRGAGRPRSFDPSDKIAAAIELFWTNGYEATSLDMLTRRLELSRSSFYACFGSKRGLLMRALEVYAAQMLDRLRAARDGAADPAAAMLHVIATTDDPMHGCLLVNCIAELAPHDEELAQSALAHLDAVAELLAASLDGAQDDRRASADALLALGVGALTMRKTGTPEARIAAVLGAGERLARR